MIFGVTHWAHSRLVLRVTRPILSKPRLPAIPRYRDTKKNPVTRDTKKIQQHALPRILTLCVLANGG